MTKLKEKFGKRLKCGEPMKSHTTFKIGGKAKYFLEVKTGQELVGAIEIAKDEGLDYAVIGKGSNLLVSDGGFEGLIVKMENRGLKIEDRKLIVGAGMSLRELSQFALDKGLTGLEWAFGVPGTVGGAIVMNAGCFGDEMGDVVVKVRYFDSHVRGSDDASPQIVSNKFSNISNMSLKWLPRRKCKFGYRKSVFKEQPEWIVLEAELKLKKGDKKEIKKKMEEYLDKRKTGQPSLPSAGSIFKKYEIRRGEKLKPSLEKILKKEHPEFLRGKYIPAGWLIEETGLKGKKIGRAQVSEQHANFIVNTGEATAEQVIMLISLIKQKVRNGFGIQLCEEVEYVGF